MSPPYTAPDRWDVRARGDAEAEQERRLRQIIREEIALEAVYRAGHDYGNPAFERALASFHAERAWKDGVKPTSAGGAE